MRMAVSGLDVSHLPERVQGPFLKHSVCQVSFGWKPTAAISGQDMCTHGAGEVLMEHFLRMGIPLADNWIRVMMLTTLRLHESFSGKVLKHYKYHVDSIIQVPYWNPLELLPRWSPDCFLTISHILR